jgi:long-chain acyl-CoA synthetase
VTLAPELLAGLPQQTLDGALHVQAWKTPDTLALVCGDETWTYRALEDRVARVAGGLREAGLRPGDKLGWLGRRDADLPVGFLATARAGGIFVPGDPGDPERVEDLLELGPRLLFDPGDAAPYAVCDTLPQLPVGAALPPSGDPRTVCYWNLTSGSTGGPKAAVTTHAQVQWNTRACLETYRWHADERYLCLFASFAHPHEHWVRPLTTGGTCIMSPATRPRTLIRVLREQRVSWLFAVPSTVRQLAREASEPLPDLRIIETGGALVESGLVALAEVRLGARVMPIWGCTEASGVVLHVPPWDPERDLEGLGRPLRHYETRLAATDDGVGELSLRGPAVVSGYDGGVEAARFADGWYRTGDLVRAAPGGGFRFAGRLQDVIKVGGLKVYLAEVERILRRHPGVADVAVVSARDPVRSEVPRAIVVADDPALTAEAITRWCRSHLRAEQRPRQVELVAALPRGPTGKVDRAALRAG